MKKVVCTRWNKWLESSKMVYMRWKDRHAGRSQTLNKTESISNIRFCWLKGRLGGTIKPIRYALSIRQPLRAWWRRVVVMISHLVSYRAQATVLGWQIWKVVCIMAEQFPLDAIIINVTIWLDPSGRAISSAIRRKYRYGQMPSTLSFLSLVICLSPWLPQIPYQLFLGTRD